MEVQYRRGFAECQAQSVGFAVWLTTEEGRAGDSSLGRKTPAFRITAREISLSLPFELGAVSLSMG